MGGVRGLVMEMVEGPTLADRLAEGPIILDEALPSGGQNPTWSRDGRVLFYQTPDLRKIMQIAIEPGDPVQVGPAKMFAEGAFGRTSPVGGNDQAADGRLLVTVRPEQNQSARPLEQLQLLLNAASAGRR